MIPSRKPITGIAPLALLATLGTALPLLSLSCDKAAPDHDHPHASASAGHGHEHHAPHGGTAVVLGDEAYHLELVADVERGILQAFVLDGHMENFIRSNAASFEIVATVAGEKRPLVFLPVGDPATGEKPGDTSLFEARADWLKTTPRFEGVLTHLVIRGGTFSGVAFTFPASPAAPHSH